jgi:hypothetical protein
MKPLWFQKENGSQYQGESFPPPIEEKTTLILVPQSPEPIVEKMNRIFSGMINRVDDREKAIYVAGDGEEVAFPVSKDTKIKTDHGVDVAFDKLKPAMSVMVAYTEDRGNIETLDVRISLMCRGVGQIQREKQREEQKKRKKNRMWL